MIFKNPKFIKFVDGKKYFDVDVIEGEHCFPYTYLESDNPENAIDAEIKKALDNKKLIVDTTENVKTKQKIQNKEIDLWAYRNQIYQKFRIQYYEILKLSYVEYKEKLFYIGDIHIFNSYYILNKTVNYLDSQNDEIELNQNDFKNLIELSLDKKVMIMNEYSRIKNELSKANTIEELNNIEWNL